MASKQKPRPDEQRALVDTGLLVAICNQADPLHDDAARWLHGFQGHFLSVEGVLTEAAFFLSAAQRAALAGQVAAGLIELHTPQAAQWSRVAAILRNYADIDPDWTDACLVWLGEKTGITDIATVDVADFSIYRLHGRRPFDLIPWNRRI